MAFTGTSLLSLPIITTGTESGAWGNITNNGLTQYLDTSIAGALSITSSITLANTSGDASGTNLASTTAQYRTLVVPASGPSANIVITAPSSNRTYHVVNRNATYTVQIRAGANSGVTLAANQSATVSYDSVAGDYVLVGPSLGIAQTFTAAQTFRAANAIRSEAASTQDAIVVAGRAGGTSSYAVTLTPTTLTANRTLTFPDATDTVAVLGSAQTFTAAQTFRAASGQDAIIIEGRGGGASSYAVTLTPTTLTANRTVTFPDATGTVILSGSAQPIEFDAGSASTPSITFTGDTNTGIYSPGADRIGFSEGGAQCGEFDSSGNFKFNSGYGSVATAYGCRAWVNFNGTGTVAIRASGNVTSITDNGVGNYTVNLTTAMPDANFAYNITGRASSSSAGNQTWAYSLTAPTTSTVHCVFQNMGTGGSTYTSVDAVDVCVAVFR